MAGGTIRRAGPDTQFERAWRGRGARIIAGIDEAGRGPLAGPVVAAAVIFEAGRIPEGLRDSKELSARNRERLYAEISACADIGVGVADVARIDRDNILRATLWAMGQAVAALRQSPCVALVDGNRPPPLSCPCETIVGGDRRSVSVAAASIIAKVTRDRMMDALALDHPGYGFERHRGYGTKAHLQALARLGPCAHHRRSFAPVAALLPA